MNEQQLRIPFVGVLEVTVHPNSVDAAIIHDMAIDGMREYLTKDMAHKWVSNPFSGQKPTAVEITDLFETFPLYIGSAPNARAWREKHANWSHAWASLPKSAVAEEANEVEDEDDVEALLRELEKLDVTGVYQHTGGGCMVAEIELQGGYFLSSSQPDGKEEGYYWGLQDHEGDLIMQGTWPGTGAAEAAQNIATMIKLLGGTSARS
ncbi:hypothetical protein [Streptomyces sp. NPDC091027]|uniref:hypothetical protein n=1 Tax=Streptomyces sp. NPDC091027 TaxID=3365971 RepID=UPI003816E9B4